MLSCSSDGDEASASTARVDQADMAPSATRSLSLLLRRRFESASIATPRLELLPPPPATAARRRSPTLDTDPRRGLDDVLAKDGVLGRLPLGEGSRNNALELERALPGVRAGECRGDNGSGGKPRGDPSGDRVTTGAGRSGDDVRGACGGTRRVSSNDEPPAEADAAAVGATASCS